MIETLTKVHIYVYTYSREGTVLGGRSVSGRIKGVTNLRDGTSAPVLGIYTYNYLNSLPYMLSLHSDVTSSV